MPHSGSDSTYTPVQFSGTTSQLQTSHPNKFAFLIAGSGAEEADIRQAVEHNQINNVLCTGLVDREVVPALLRESDIGIVSLRPSPVFETVVPTKMYEYMAAGLPIISNVAGEAESLLSRSKAGLTVKGGSATAYSNGILDLADDDAKRFDMSESGQRFISENISWDATADAYLDVLNSVVS